MRVVPLLKEALTILANSSTKNERELSACISTCVLAMYEDDEIQDIRKVLELYMKKYIRKNGREDKSDSERAEAIKQVMKDLDKKFKDKDPKTEEEFMDIVNDVIDKSKDKTGIQGVIIADATGTLDPTQKGSQKGQDAITNAAVELSKTDNKTDEVSSEILTKLLLARKFGFIGVMHSDVSKSNAIYKLFSDVLLNDHKSIKEKQEAADKILNDPEIDQSVKDLINSSLNNSKN